MANIVYWRPISSSFNFVCTLPTVTGIASPADNPPYVSNPLHCQSVYFHIDMDLSEQSLPVDGQCFSLPLSHSLYVFLVSQSAQKLPSARTGWTFVRVLTVHGVARHAVYLSDLPGDTNDPYLWSCLTSWSDWTRIRPVAATDYYRCCFCCFRFVLSTFCCVCFSQRSISNTESHLFCAK